MWSWKSTHHKLRLRECARAWRRCARQCCVATLMCLLVAHTPSAVGVLLTNAGCYVWLRGAIRTSGDRACLSSLGFGPNCQPVARSTDLSCALYRQSAALEPGNPTAHRGLGRSLLASGETPEAIAELSEAVELNPADCLSTMLLGDAYALSGEYDESMRFWTKASGSHFAAERLRIVALEHLRSGQGELAVSLFWKAIRHAPGSKAAGYAYVNLANLAKDDRNYHTAKLYYERALALLPRNAESLGNLGWILGNVLNRPQEAIQYLQQATLEAPDYPWWWYMLAEQYARLGMCTEADVALSKSELLFNQDKMPAPADMAQLISRWSAGRCERKAPWPRQQE